MNIIAGDLFTHLSVVIDDPDVDVQLRVLYKQVLFWLETHVDPVDPAAISLFPCVTGNNLMLLGQLIYDIFVSEQKPGDEEVPLTDD